jgi:hypothetical protein
MYGRRVRLRLHNLRTGILSTRYILRLYYHVEKVNEIVAWCDDLKVYSNLPVIFGGM